MVTSRYSVSRVDMMTAKMFVRPDNPQPWYIVSIDALVDSQDGWPLATIKYSSRDFGIRREPNEWSNPIRRSEFNLLTDHEFVTIYTQEVRQEGLFHIGELPEQIDVEATVARFMDQINRRDFTRPTLALLSNLSLKF